MLGIIYCYTSPSGKKYIGQTTILEKVNERNFSLVDLWQLSSVDAAEKDYFRFPFKGENLRSGW